MMVSTSAGIPKGWRLESPDLARDVGQNIHIWSIHVAWAYSQPGDGVPGQVCERACPQGSCLACCGLALESTYITLTALCVKAVTSHIQVQREKYHLLIGSSKVLEVHVD